jgi:beta-N-acetylhexosaminidase
MTKQVELRDSSEKLRGRRKLRRGSNKWLLRVVAGMWLIAILGLGAFLVIFLKGTSTITQTPTPHGFVLQTLVGATITPVTNPTGTTSPTNQPKSQTSIPGVTASPDPLNQRVNQIMSRMTLEEKVGQLFLVFFTGPELSPALREMINQYHIGGIVLFAISDNIRSTSQVARLINDTQNEAATHGAGVPLLVAIDQEGGPIVRLTQGATVFPSNMAVGATGSIEDARLMAEVTAAELEALGINMNLAPVMDVNNNPDNPIIGVRSFGSSPDQVAQLGVAMIQTYKANGVIATAKHFPGHGDTAVDSHLSLPVIPHDLNHLEAVELAPFRAAIGAGVDAIMTAHVLIPAIEANSRLPATLSSKVLQGLLRDKLGYQGLIVSDSMGMGAIDQMYGVTEATAMAFQAGDDILAFGADPTHSPAEQRPAYERVLALVRSGMIPSGRLDESVRRILLVKARYGLLDWKAVNVDQVPQQVGNSQHVGAARKVAQDSITLVRNNAGVLPIASDKSVLVIWPQGSGNLGGAIRAVHPNTRILQVSLDPSPGEVEEAALSAATASVVVVGTVDARRYPGQARLVNALSSRPLVVAALGVPYDLMAFPNVTTYLATYGDVPMSLEALAQVLFGLSKPKGHLPVELPGLYPWGYGLSDFTEGNK